MKHLKTFEQNTQEDKIITTAYQIVTPESAENGDYEETGWYDEEGESMIPDEFDDEDETIISKAVKFLKDHYVDEPFSFYKNLDYYSSSPDHNYQTGEETSYSYHLNGFTEEEEYEIFKVISNFEEKQMKKEIGKFNL